MKAIKIMCNLALAGSLLMVIASPLTSQTPPGDPLAEPVRVKLDNVNTRDTVAEALYQAGVPGGIAVLHYCGEFPRHVFKPANTSVRALLDEVVSADPSYSWRLDEGVVNLTPRNVKLHFLDTKVSKLELKFKNPDEAMNILLALPEVQGQANKELGSRLFQGSLYPFSPNSTVDRQEKSFSLLLTDTTVAGALNSIARAYGNGIWILVKDECTNGGRRTFSIKFINK